MRSIVAGVILGLGLAGPASAAEPAEAGAGAEPAVVTDGGWTRFRGDPIGVVERRLDNGLTVLLSENHELPRVFGAVVVQAGGSDDPASATGIAHYLEHMLFKGTAELGTVDYAAERPHLAEIEALYEALREAEDGERAEIYAAIDRAAQAAGGHAIPGELDRVLQDLGAARVNAFTTPDITVYHNELPAGSLDRWLEVYSHRFVDPVFRLFPSELEAVYEEKNRAMDGYDPIADEFLARLFPGHPYGTQTILGSVDHLKRPSLTAMYAFYRRNYVPAKMALVLAGDFDPAAIWPRIEATFGTWPKGRVEETPARTVEPLRGRASATVRMTPVRALGLGFRLPPEGHPDHPAVLVCNELLTNAQGAGRLDRLGRSGAVLFAQAVPIPLNQYGVGLIAVVPRIVTQTFAGAERKLLGAIGALRRGEFSDAELAAARRAILGRAARTWETNEERVLEMVATFGRGQSWQVTSDALAATARVDRQAVIAAAERYYGDDYLAFRSRVGFPKKARLDKPTLQPVVPAVGARSAFARRLAATPERRQAPRFVDVGRAIDTALAAPGVVVHANQNPYNDIYTLELRFGVGRFAIRELAVVGDYLARVGTRERSADALRAALFELATTLEIEATEEALILRLAGPEPELAAALALVDELLRGPAEDAAALRRVRRERWGRALVERRQPRVIADALREYASYGELSTYLRDLGPRELRRLTPRDLNAAFAAAQGYAATVRYVGRRSAAEVAREVAGAVRFRGDLRPAVAKVVRPRIARDSDAVFLVKRRQSLQSHLYVLVEGEAMAGDQRAGAAGLSEYLGGGMGGLIFQEVRELRALAYSARGKYYEGPVVGAPGALLAYVATQGDKTVDALDLVARLIRELPEREGRIADVREALIRSTEAAYPGFRELQETVEGWRLLGFYDDPRRSLLPALAGLDFAAIRRFHDAHVRGRPMTVMLVGDPRRFDRAAIERFGPVTVVPSRALFAR